MIDVVETLRGRLAQGGNPVMVSRDTIRAAIKEIERLRGRYESSQEEQESQTEVLTELRKVSAAFEALVHDPKTGKESK